jgi:sugar lactone lactonase YvrE
MTVSHLCHEKEKMAMTNVGTTIEEWKFGCDAAALWRQLKIVSFAFLFAVGGDRIALAAPTPTPTPTTPVPQSLPEDGYRWVKNWPTLPNTKSMNWGHWGEVPGIDVGPDGNIWVIHRCFGTEPAMAATCVGRNEYPPILEFDRSGHLLAQFGNGMIVFVHGSHVDREGNVWVTDAGIYQNPISTRGNQVFKFSPTGKLLMTLGTAGVKGNGPNTFDLPTDVVTAPNGDIFVADGHGANDRIVKFSKDGKFIKAWGKTGSEPGEFNQPHTLAMDSQGRLFVGDRSNSRIQIFDQDGNFIAQWTQFGRPSGIAIGPDDTIYVTDSTTMSANNPGRKRGIYIGDARTGAVTGLIPDPDVEKQDVNAISGATGIAVGPDGSVYCGDIGPRRVRKYVKVKP